MNQCIPPKCTINNSAEVKRITSIIYEVEESDKIYFKCFINHDKGDGKRSFSHKNREKTRLLYPDIYNEIQGKNISVKYTHIEE